MPLPEILSLRWSSTRMVASALSTRRALCRPEPLTLQQVILGLDDQRLGLAQLDDQIGGQVQLDPVEIVDVALLLDDFTGPGDYPDNTASECHNHCDQSYGYAESSLLVLMDLPLVF